ncbi:DNA polymerase III subunit delta' [Alsobacter soli]|uniref:DNA polymerase III subunit delta n=1 Tax=Alsobacter soli TaxID=2109933 RepID=A0A2T1HQ53_9HYPH|nr:DNA polymerase III subunit delta' [Alsobacter soli]PSC03798.1 DNA polymerase III subunit delta' [Alsobacter soli]
MAQDDDIPEVDRLPNAPHPRFAHALVGQEAAEAAFLDAYRGGRFPHAWILGGPEGIGKATFAYRAARFVLAHPDPHAPEVRAARNLDVSPESGVFRRVAALAHTSLFVVRRQYNAEKKSMPTQIPVELVRKAVAFFGSTAGEGGWRVCIVDSAEDLNVQGANALLKVIEEPPPRSLFLLVSHLPGRLLPTIRSRCRMLRFRTLSEVEVARAVTIAAEEDAPDPSIVQRAAALSGGTVRGAFKIMDESALAIVEHIRQALERLPEIDWKDAHAIAEGLAGRANDAAYETAIETIFAWLGEQTVARAGEGPRRLAPLAEVWEKATRTVRETDSYNLDRRALVLTLFTDLSDALRASRAA